MTKPSTHSYFYLIVALLLCAPETCFGREALQFEVASVKLATGEGANSMTGGPGTSDPGRFSCHNMPLRLILLRAFGISRYELLAPEWANIQRYDLEAKVPLGTTKDQFALMLRDLLETRLQMTFHRTRKAVEILSLQVGKTNPKLIEWGKRPPGPSGSTESQNGEVVRHLAGMDMDALAQVISANTDKLVVNETGLQGQYDMTLRFFPQSLASDGPMAGSNFVDAVQSQLGLKVVDTKKVIEVVQIDRLSRVPSQN